MPKPLLSHNVYAYVYYLSICIHLSICACVFVCMFDRNKRSSNGGSEETKNERFRRPATEDKQRTWMRQADPGPSAAVSRRLQERAPNLYSFVSKCWSSQSFRYNCMRLCKSLWHPHVCSYLHADFPSAFLRHFFPPPCPSLRPSSPGSLIRRNNRNCDLLLLITEVIS